ncbi:hypothetical protein [Runella sp.]|uniref:hypothetical protein n=1 Tax=Runella sp. TaxID=1960881 RepID=UPI00301A193B
MESLFCVITYLKGEIRQDQLAVFFEMDQPKASKYLSLIQRILLQVLETNPRGIPKGKKEYLLKALL